MNTKKNMSVYAITLSGIMVALAIIVKIFTPYFPLAGTMVVRFDLHGPFASLPAVMFGPVVGGVVGGLVDFLGYLLANKTPTGYLPLLTFTAILNGFVFGLLWLFLRKVKPIVIKGVYLFMALMTTLLGLLSYLALNNGPSISRYGQFLSGLGGRIEGVPMALMVVGGVALLVFVFHFILEKRMEQGEVVVQYFVLFIALVIPALMVSYLNTLILRFYIPTLQNMALSVFLVPRLGLQLVETFYTAYVLAGILVIARPYLKNRS